MKNQLLVMISLIAILLSGNLKAQDIVVPETHKTLFTKLTADWCGPCGGWGWQWFDSFVHEYETGVSMALPVAMHISSSHNKDLNFSGPHQSFFLANYDKSMSGFPDFGVGRKLTIGRPMVMRDEVKKATASASVANAGFISVVSGNTMKIKTKTKFFKAASGEFLVDVYLYEDSIISYQNAQSDTAIHKRILRAIPSLPSPGKQIPGNTFVANDVFEDSVSFTIPGAWNRKRLHVFTVIWKKGDKLYDIINVNDVATFPLSVNDLAQSDNGIHIYPNPASDRVIVEVAQLGKPDVSVNILDMMGRVVYAQTLNTSDTNIVINTSGFSNGFYNIIITSADARLSERLVISR
jgi:hypothetical protein